MTEKEEHLVNGNNDYCLAVVKMYFLLTSQSEAITIPIINLSWLLHSVQVKIIHEHRSDSDPCFEMGVSSSNVPMLCIPELKGRFLVDLIYHGCYDMQSHWKAPSAYIQQKSLQMTFSLSG